MRITLLLILAVFQMGVPARAQSDPTGQEFPAPAPVVEAPNPYHFIFFFRDQTPETDAMWNVFQSAMQKAGNRATPYSVNLNDPSSAQYVQAYNLGNPTTPLALSVAPNGAVMGVFSQQFTEQQLLESFGTPAQEACQLHLLQGKIVMVCLQNERTQFNREALSGVQMLLQDFRFEPYAAAVMVNPADPVEASLLQQLQVTPNIPTAMTVLMTPPGVPVATFNGATTKETLIAELKGQGGCGANCQCLESVPEGGDSKPVLSKFFNKIAGKFKG